MSTMSPGKRITLMIGIGGITAAAIIYLAPAASVVEKPESLKRLSAMKMLYLGIRLYADDHEGQCPPTLDTLIEEKYLHQKPKLLAIESGGKEIFSPHLRYHKPPPDTTLSSLEPNSILLSYSYEKHESTVNADGSGQTRRK